MLKVNNFMPRFSVGENTRILLMMLPDSFPNTKTKEKMSPTYDTTIISYHTYVYRIYYRSIAYICDFMIYIHVGIPIRVTVPDVLVMVMFGAECNIHWKVVVPLIENTVSEYLVGVVGLFS